LGAARVAADPAMTTRTSLDVQMHPDSAGTPAYMSPQQLAGQAADAQSDVYGVGVHLYELLTGRRPFEALDVVSLAVRATTGPTPPVSSLRPDVPRLVDEVVARAMAKSPRDRFQTAADLRDALMTVRRGRASPYRSRQLLWIGIASAIAVSRTAAGWARRPGP